MQSGNKKAKKHRNKVQDIWVECLNCGEQYYIESFEIGSSCPSCSSNEYEEAGYRLYPKEDLYE